MIWLLARHGISGDRRGLAEQRPSPMPCPPLISIAWDFLCCIALPAHDPNEPPCTEPYARWCDRESEWSHTYVNSMACFSHGKLLDKADMPRPSELCRTRHEMLIATPRLSMSPLAIYYQSRGAADEKSIDPSPGEIPDGDVLKLDSSLKSNHARRTIAAESDTEQTCGR